MLTEIAELLRMRRQEYLTYRELAKRAKVPEATMRRILTVPMPRIHDRTLFKIRDFLESRRPRRRPEASPRVASASRSVAP